MRWHWPSEMEWLVGLGIFLIWVLYRQVEKIAAVQQEIRQKIEWLADRRWDDDHPKK